VRDAFPGDLTLTLVPIERASVQVGIARRTAHTLRLNRTGIRELDPARIPAIDRLRRAGGYEENEPLALETYGKLFLNKWRRITGHYRYAQTDTNQVPPTDVTAAISPILLPHKSKSRQYRLAWTPGRRFGVSAGRTTEERQNLNRDIWIRHDASDVHGSLVTWGRFTTAVGASWWNHFTSQPILSALLSAVKSTTIDLSWDFASGLVLFASFRRLEYSGPRLATERIAESGVRFTDGNRTGFDGRIAIAHDRLRDATTPANDYLQTSLNVAGTTRF
jgi:hypothetical protein